MAAKSLTPEQSSARVLVVDDQPANVKALGTMLGKLGCEVVPAPDGPTALERVELGLPDLILLDALLSGMDGFEVCQRIRENPGSRDIPIIFLSASGDQSLIVRAFEAGGVDYVTTPFNQAELSSRVRTHLSLKAARDRLHQLSEDKDELIGVLAHDLKSHLSGMQMSAQILRDRTRPLGDVRLSQLCDNIVLSGTQLLGFVKEFLANAAAAEQGLAPKRDSVNLAGAAALIVRRHQDGARRKNLELKVTLPERGSTVLVDHNALNHVLDNLLSNAIKFSPPDREISVKVRGNCKFAECTVQDHGPGFTIEDKARMFRRYTRLSARPTGGEPSTGLGLSIVKKLVEAMDGQLTCDSAPGKGAKFTVKLPRPV